MQQGQSPASKTESSCAQSNPSGNMGWSVDYRNRIIAKQIKMMLALGECDFDTLGMMTGDAISFTDRPRSIASSMNPGNTIPVDNDSPHDSYEMITDSNGIEYNNPLFDMESCGITEEHTDDGVPCFNIAPRIVGHDFIPHPPGSPFYPQFVANHQDKASRLCSGKDQSFYNDKDFNLTQLGGINTMFHEIMCVKKLDDSHIELYTMRFGEKYRTGSVYIDTSGSDISAVVSYFGGFALLLSDCRVMIYAHLYDGGLDLITRKPEFDEKLNIPDFDGVYSGALINYGLLEVLVGDKLYIYRLGRKVFENHMLARDVLYYDRMLGQLDHYVTKDFGSVPDRKVLIGYPDYSEEPGYEYSPWPEMEEVD